MVTWPKVAERFRGSHAPENNFTHAMPLHTACRCKQLHLRQTTADQCCFLLSIFSTELIISTITFETALHRRSDEEGSQTDQGHWHLSCMLGTESYTNMDMADAAAARAKAVTRRPAPRRQSHPEPPAFRKAHRVRLYNNRRAPQQANWQTKTRKSMI